jgi:hypothetical protein
MDIAILEVPFTITAPYAEGHTLTAAEASALNQLRRENIGNNFRKAVAAAKEKPEGAEREAAIADIRARMAEYDASYQFSIGGTRGSGTTETPLERAAKSLAKGALLLQLKAAGLTFKAYKADKGDEYVEAKLAEIAAMEEVQKEAKEVVKQAEKKAERLAKLTVTA